MAVYPCQAVCETLRRHSGDQGPTIRLSIEKMNIHRVLEVRLWAFKLRIAGGHIAIRESMAMSSLSNSEEQYLFLALNYFEAGRKRSQSWHWPSYPLVLLLSLPYSGFEFGLFQSLIEFQRCFAHVWAYLPSETMRKIGETILRMRTDKLSPLTFYRSLSASMSHPTFSAGIVVGHGAG